MGEKFAASPEEVSQKWRQFRASGKPVRLSHISECIDEICDSLNGKGDVEIALAPDRLNDSRQVLIGRYNDEEDQSLRTPVSVRLNGVVRLDQLEVTRMGYEVRGLRLWPNMTTSRISPRYVKLSQVLDSLLDALEHTLELGLPRGLYIHPVFDLANSP